MLASRGYGVIAVELWGSVLRSRHFQYPATVNGAWKLQDDFTDSTITLAIRVRLWLYAQVEFVFTAHPIGGYAHVDGAW